jgi:hypothetical protein
MVFFNYCYLNISFSQYFESYWRSSSSYSVDNYSAAISDWISLLIEETNYGYQNSAVPIKLRLRYIKESIIDERNFSSTLTVHDGFLKRKNCFKDNCNIEDH